MTFWPILRSRGSALAFRLVVGGFFLAAAIGKLAHPVAFFAGQVKAYGIVPAGWELPLAQGLPWLELFSGGFLLIGLFARPAAAAVGAQLAIFGVVLAVSIAAGFAPEDCGCIPGVSETPMQALARDAIMLGWMALAWPGLPGRLALDAWLGASADEGDEEDEGAEEG